MGENLREKEFRLGCWHGKLQAKKKKEHQLQRGIFLTQKICFWENKKSKPIIRLFGYEVPLKEKVTRGTCVDLMGYGKDHNLYIIELKDKGSKESMEEIKEQINDYAKTVAKIQKYKYIEKEFRETFFFPDNFEFREIKKMLLADKEFYKNKKYPEDDGILYCYINSNDLEAIKKMEPRKVIKIHLQKEWNAT